MPTQCGQVQLDLGALTAQSKAPYFEWRPVPRARRPHVLRVLGMAWVCSVRNLKFLVFAAEWGAIRTLVETTYLNSPSSAVICYEVELVDIWGWFSRWNTVR